MVELSQNLDPVRGQTDDTASPPCLGQPEKTRVADFSVSCIILTYADRRHLLRCVLKRLSILTPSIESVVLVFNGVDYDAREFISDLGLPLTIHPEILPTNLGSAAGYAYGLVAASTRTTSAYVWLLDDDNLPDDAALQRLQAAWTLLGRGQDQLLLSLRQDRWEYLAAAYTGEHEGFIANAFYNVHLGRILRRRLSGWRPFAGRPATDPPYPLVSVGYAPYGGLLMHRHWTTEVNLPDAAFFVYGDDHDYTDRIVQAGGRIYLCATSIVRDIESSWFQRGSSRCHYLLDPEAPSLRAYLGLRDRVATEMKRHVNSRPLYLLNATVFTVRILLSARQHWLHPAFWRRLRLLASAFREGWTGKLQPIDDAQQPWINRHA